MTGLLLLVSFIIHIVLLFIVYKLYVQVNALRRSKNDELENILDTFLQEIKDENAVLQRQLSHKSDEKWHETQPQNVNKEEQVSQIEGQEQLSRPFIEEKEDEYAPSIQGQVYQLHSEGMSIEEIAKRLNRGKTEIELMVKFKENLK